MLGIGDVCYMAEGTAQNDLSTYGRILHLSTVVVNRLVAYTAKKANNINSISMIVYFTLHLHGC